MKKRGASHIEFILAFILFIGAVSTALVLFSPVKSDVNQDSSLEYSFNQIVKNASTSVETYSIKIRDISLETEPFGVMISSPSDYNVRVEDYYGKEFPSRKIDDNIYFDFDDNDFFILTLSEDIDPYPTPPTPTAPVDEDKYIIAFVDSKSTLSEKKLLDLNETYYLDYELLKKNLGIPASRDFGFIVNFNQGEIIKAEKNIPTTTNIFADIKRKEIIRKQGGTVFAEITVKVW